MLIGDRYRFTLDTLSVDPATKRTVLILQDAIVEIVSFLKDRSMVAVLRDGQTLLLFEQDLEKRCEKVTLQ